MIRAGTINARCQRRLVGEDIKVVTIIEVTIIPSLGSTFAAVAAADLTDNTLANSNSGTVGLCLVSPSAGDAGVDGEVGLGLDTGGMLETFSGASLPAGWTSGTYGDPSVSFTMSGDVL